MSLRYCWRTFAELKTTELYALLQLRAQVFVVEQHCPFVDPDGLDPQASHLLVWDDEVLVGCARVFPPPDPEAAVPAGSGSASRVRGAVSVGRIVSAASHRGCGLGRDIMHRVLDWARENHPDARLRLGAQARLRRFYEGFGFEVCGTPYLEDGIAHIPMQSGQKTLVQ